MIGSYAIALVLASPASGIVGEIVQVPGFLRLPVAGGLLFVMSFVVLGLITRLLIVWERSWRGPGPRSGLDRAGGGTIGFMRGALIVLLLGPIG